MTLPEKGLEEAEKDLEKDLEEEIQRDAYIPPRANKWARFRHKGAHVLHTKHVLLLVVILNLVDCALVLSELILDIHYVKELRTEMDGKAQIFIDEMQDRYPDHLKGYSIDTIDLLYNEVYEADCYWSNSGDDDDDTNSSENRTRRAAVQKLEMMNKRLEESGRYRRASDGGHRIENGMIVVDHPHSILEDIAHAFHKASIAILGVLFVENLMKILFNGMHFFKRKLEVFDAIVVAVSFTVDLVLLKGIMEFEVQVALFILSFLLPWRVIRLVNSLIVAVLDHEHFRLKLMYKEKKAVDAQLAVYKDMKKRWESHLQKIEAFCEGEGIPKWKIRQHTAMARRHSVVNSMASLALNSVLQNLHVGFLDNKMKSENSSKTSSTEDLQLTVSKDQGVVNEGFQGDGDQHRHSVTSIISSDYEPQVSIEGEVHRKYSTQILVKHNKH